MKKNILTNYPVLMSTALMLFIMAGLGYAANTYYVTTNGTGDGSSWASPTNSIQGAIDAIDGSDPTHTVWVSNGVYKVGGIAGYPVGFPPNDVTNRIVINKAITVRSANNDPTNTIIKGQWDPATNGPAAVRCVYMVAGSTLIGFTLTNGATSLTGWDANGGGVLTRDAGVIISNCVIAGNSAAVDGGGAANLNLYNCLIAGNSAVNAGGGAAGGTMSNCRIVGNSAKYGGGANSFVVLYNCMIVSNSANTGYGGGVCDINGWGSKVYNCTFIGNSANYGGGVTYCALYNCLIVGNSAIGGCGGVYLYNNGPVYNCTIVSNSAPYGGGVGGNGSGDNFINCIVYLNTSSFGGFNYYNFTPGAVNFTNSCTAPDPGGFGNTTYSPLFVSMDTGNYRLSANSPCVNTGTNASYMTDPADVRSKDLDGQKRVQYVTVDMGAYEFINSSTIFRFR